jgi:5'-phosphate synthase pdxT subunit
MSNIKIGVLALQGAFREHIDALKKIPGVEAFDIRTSNDMYDGDRLKIDGLIIPGGESTAIATVGTSNGTLDAVRKFVQKGNPTWGTCAGCILLANQVSAQKTGGQPLIGGMDISVQRNYFGRQVASFEADLALDALDMKDKPFPGIFIRAPAILDVIQPSDGSKPPVKILGSIPNPNKAISDPSTKHPETLVVAAQQGNMVATVFHPELTTDTRFHEYFVEVARKNKAQQQHA